MSAPLCVLILEDRATDAELMLHELRRVGYEPDWRRVDTELDYRTCLVPTLDVILADYTLPQFDALRALHFLQGRGFDIPFIVVTGSVGEEAAVECMKQGATDYLLKDRLGRLGAAVERALQQKHLRDEKRQAEAALRESEERWQFALEGSGDGVWDWNLPTNQVSYSKRYKEMLGFAEDEFGNALEEWTGRLHPDDVECLISEQQKHFRGETPIVIVEYRMRCKDGSYKWILDRGKIMEYAENGTPVRMVGTHTDITDRKQADEEIKRLNRDLERRAKGLAALNKASQVMASTLELRVLLGRVMEQAKSLLDAEAASMLLHTAVLEEGGDELVFAAVTGSASEKLVGTRLPMATGVAGWVIRERRPALVADAQSDPHFDNRTDAVTGMTTRSLLAVPLLFQDTTQGALEAVNKVNGTFDQDDLEMLEALASSAAIAIENARLYATELERTAALARALEQQRELDRLQREFIQNVSHELRTPLAIIRGHAELLETGELGNLQAIQQKSASVISRRTQMLSKLVDDIIAVLTIESQELKREPLSLAQLVRTSMADFQAAAETAGLTLSAEIAPDLPLVSGDSVALHRMLDNLVSNALKFTSANGRVTMRLFSDKGTVTLQVSDTGVGISSDQLERIFDRFYQVDGSTTRRYGGVGLGLALVKEIVEAHGGQITVASQVGQGTTFTVSLPAGET
jgi:PAS domain S-box-containing protein